LLEKISGPPKGEWIELFRIIRKEILSGLCRLNRVTVYNLDGRNIHLKDVEGGMRTKIGRIFKDTALKIEDDCNWFRIVASGELRG
jgi:hypothetical protein